MPAAGGIPALVAVLQAHGESHPVIAERACGALRLLAFDAGHTRAIAAAGGIEVVSVVLYAHGKTIAGLAKSCCALLEFLALNDPASKRTIVAAGGDKVVEAVMAAHLADPVLQQWGAETLRALGLPAVEAPGEAEATCAAMNAAGLVDGCATSDGDALLFGARVQFKTIKLFADAPEQSRIERCEASWLRETMRLPGDEHEGVSDALVALALLAGGDYDPDGAKRVGSALASRVVKGLAAEDARERRKSGSPGLRPSTTRRAWRASRTPAAGATQRGARRGAISRGGSKILSTTWSSAT